MQKRISVNEYRSAVRVAQACNPLIVKRDKVTEKINALKEEYDALDTQVKALEAGITQYLGVRVESIVKKVIETNTDNNGKIVKTTKYLPTDSVVYDSEKKQYIIDLPAPAPAGTLVEPDIISKAIQAVTNSFPEDVEESNLYPVDEKNTAADNA